MFRGKRKFIVIGAAGVAAVAATGVAYAYWNASGSGTAGAKAVTKQVIQVTAGTGAADLYPGNTQGDLYFSMQNDNPYPVLFTGMTAGTVTSGDPTNCPAGNVTVANATGLNLAVPANGTAPGSILNVVSMSTNAPDLCSGVSFTINLTLAGAQTP